MYVYIRSFSVFKEEQKKRNLGLHVLATSTKIEVKIDSKIERKGI